MQLKLGITKSNPKLVCALLLLLFLCELLITSWLTDDSYITLRTVLNFINGFGPTFNVDERVQAYTHPLWFLLLSGLAYLMHDVFIAAFMLGFICSIIAFYLLLTKFTADLYRIIFVGCCIILSKTFVDFSTSGLENPLTHCVIISTILAAQKFFTQPKPGNLTLSLFCCSLLYLTRFDTIIIILPLLVLVLTHANAAKIKLFLPLSMSILPIASWHLFTLYYYGFLWPNTAYAKLGAGIPVFERLEQGVRYLICSLLVDPLCIVCLFLAIIMVLMKAKDQPKYKLSLAFGIILYCLYIISIGGDFMAGRFFTPPFLVALILLILTPIHKNALLYIIVLGLININLTLFDSPDNRVYKNPSINMYIFMRAIVDEKAFYYPATNLLIHAFQPPLYLPQWKITHTTKVNVACGFLGRKSIIAGPAVHFIDICGLSDPLLARLPAQYKTTWRIGHFTRIIPKNYLHTIATKTNQLEDHKTKTYYQAIMTITRGPLNSWTRFKTIILFNLGFYPKPDANLYKFPSATNFALQDAQNFT